MRRSRGAGPFWHFRRTWTNFSICEPFDRWDQVQQLPRTMRLQAGSHRLPPRCSRIRRLRARRTQRPKSLGPLGNKGRQSAAGCKACQPSIPVHGTQSSHPPPGETSSDATVAGLASIVAFPSTSTAIAQRQSGRLVAHRECHVQHRRQCVNFRCVGRAVRLLAPSLRFGMDVIAVEWQALSHARTGRHEAAALWNRMS